MECRYRRSWEPAALLAAHPPVFRHPHKQLAFELASAGAAPSGSIEVTRWAPAAVPDRALEPTAVEATAGFYDYAGDHAGVWHVNFADPRLFAAYGSALLAQDELQCVEHPLLGSIREAMVADGVAATIDRDGPTPVLVAGVERRCALVEMYGTAFARASASAVRDAIRPIAPPTISNLIAMAAPSGGRGPYFHDDLADILATAFTAFDAAVAESHRRWPGAPVEIRTGFWGCGAFGGNRRAMTALQLLAARLAGVDRVRFHAADGLDDFRRGAADLDGAIARGGAVLEQLDELDYEWGTPDGT